MNKIMGILSGFFLVLVLASPISAASTLFGSAVNDSGVIKTVSNTSNGDSADDYGGISFDDANGITFENLTALSVDYNVTDDDCGGGSPRFSIRMDTDGNNISDGNIFVYLGPIPSFTGCTQNTWLNSDNLILSTDTRFDLTQLGGPFYGTYADAVALLSSDIVLRISLVTDAGWIQTDGEQEVWFDNVVINGMTYDFTPLLGPSSMDECKKGGWMTFNNPFFKNQGDCVSYLQSSENATGNRKDN